MAVYAGFSGFSPEGKSPKALHPSAQTAPDHLPKRVDELYSQALGIMGDAPEPAGMALRKTLEIGLKTIRRNDDDKLPLKARINRAARDGDITPELGKWAERIQLDGNDAAHAYEAVTPEKIKDLQQFTHLVLMYLFTLPGMLKKWGEKKEADA